MVIVITHHHTSAIQLLKVCIIVITKGRQNFLRLKTKNLLSPWHQHYTVSSKIIISSKQGFCVSFFKSNANIRIFINEVQTPIFYPSSDIKWQWEVFQPVTTQHGRISRKMVIAIAHHHTLPHSTTKFVYSYIKQSIVSITSSVNSPIPNINMIEHNIHL